MHGERRQRLSRGAEARLFRWEKSLTDGTFAYINLFRGGILSFRAANPSPFHSRILETGIDGRNTVEGLYLSLNGNRIPTCYFLWEDFLGPSILRTDS